MNPEQIYFALWLIVYSTILTMAFIAKSEDPSDLFFVFVGTILIFCIVTMFLVVFGITPNVF